MRYRMTAAASVMAATICSNLSIGQQSPEPPPADIVAKIKQEGLERSKVMETASYLTDVYGARLTGSPITKAAGEWAKKQLTEWGLENAHLEPWGPFGRGWTLEAFSANLLEPNFSPLIAYPKAWSPSTSRTIRGEPILLDVTKAEDLEKYRGKLLRSIVMISPPREVKALFEPPASRKTDESLLELANADPASRRRGRFGGGPGSGPFSGGPGQAAGGPPAAPGTGAPPAVAGNAPPPGGDARNPFGASTQLTADKWQFAYSEGAAVVLEPGRGDGGTVFVSQATLPRRPEASGSRGPADAGGGGAAPFGGRQGRAQPWSPESNETLPQVVMAVEHYNRIARMIQKGAHPVVEIDIGAKFHSEDLNSFNIIAEIPGTDLKDEIVMLGAHFDSWQAGTGATDNGIGCAVAMEAVRILKAIDAKPRRTIRIGLWTGEEQGLLGSRAYVSDHFGKQVAATREPSADASTAGEEGRGGRGGRGGAGGFGQGGGPGGRSRLKYELKPEHEKFSAYYNLDNGAGKIRGVYLQGNENLRATFRAWLTPFNDMGASTVTVSNTGGTDHLSFDNIGLPGFQFIQDPIEYDTRTHHSSMDVYERLQADDAKQASIIMATFVYQTAMLNEKLTRKPFDGEVVSPASASQTSAVTPKLPAVAPAAAAPAAATPQP